MNSIRIAYIDFWKSFDADSFLFTKLLRKHFDVIIDYENPDFVFCGTSGHEYLKYKAVRIKYTGEAICPDFNLYDYGIGFDNISFEDRYYRFPLCYLDEKTLDCINSRVSKPDDYYLNRSKFCNYVVSAGGGYNDVRDRIFDEICQYKTIDSGGRYRNNLPDKLPVKDKFSFQEGYRFTLALENTSYPGYTTEKIMDAWAAGTIPIYWGDPYIKKYFNEDSFINISDYDNYDELRRRIQEINENDSLFLSMVKAPVMKEYDDKLSIYEGLEHFLCTICSQDSDSAYRRSSMKSMLGTFNEYKIKRWEKFEDNKFYSFLRESKRKFFGTKNIRDM